MFKGIEVKLFLRILVNEKFYLFGSFIVFSALFVILFLMFVVKELYINYSDINLRLLPQHALIVSEKPSEVYTILHKNGITREKILLARVKDYKNISIYTNINKENTLAKNYTLMSFDMRIPVKLHFICAKKEYFVNLLDVSFRQKKYWQFKTEHLDGCAENSSVQLRTQKSTIALQIKYNRGSAKLVYKVSVKHDKKFYKFLIALEERLFIKYSAYSKYFSNQNSKFSLETQEHAKMLHSLFSIIFANTKQKVLLNTKAYDFLSSYKKIPFTIQVSNTDFLKHITVIDTLALNLTNNKKKIYSKIIVANLSSLNNIEYDYTLIYSSAKIDKDLFKNAIVINREDFISVQKSNTSKINISILIITILLFVFFLAIINSFISRSYNLYKEKFFLCIFHGLRVKVVTLIIVMLLLTSVILAYALSFVMLGEVNSIFSNYYVDLVQFEFEKAYFSLFIFSSIVAAYFIEQKYQNKIISG